MDKEVSSCTVILVMTPSQSFLLSYLIHKSATGTKLLPRIKNIVSFYQHVCVCVCTHTCAMLLYSLPCLLCKGSCHLEHPWSADHLVRVPQQKQWSLHSSHPPVVQREENGSLAPSKRWVKSCKKTQKRCFTYCCPGCVHFLLQLVKLHFQDFLIWHIPGHPGCEGKTTSVQLCSSKNAPC